MTKELIEEATKLADDIAEYAPNTNIESVIRRLTAELKMAEAIISATQKTKERLQSEKIARS